MKFKFTKRFEQVIPHVACHKGQESVPAYRLDDRGVIVQHRQEHFLLLKLLTNDEAHPGSYLEGTGTLFPGVKRTGCESHHSPQSMAKVKNECSCAYTFHMPSWCAQGRYLKCRLITLIVCYIYWAYYPSHVLHVDIWENISKVQILMHIAVDAPHGNTFRLTVVGIRSKCTVLCSYQIVFCTITTFDRIYTKKELLYLKMKLNFIFLTFDMKPSRSSKTLVQGVMGIFWGYSDWGLVLTTLLFECHCDWFGAILLPLICACKGMSWSSFYLHSYAAPSS